MRRSFIMFSLATIGLLCASGQSQPVSESLSDKLSKPLPIGSGDLSVVNAFTRALSEARLPGGFELIRCGPTLPQEAFANGLTAREVMATIQRLQPDLEISVSGGMVKMLSNLGHGLLNTKIAELELDNVEDAKLSLRQILETPEVRRAAAAQGLQERPGEVGFTSLPKPGARIPPPKPAHFRDLTVEEALDAAAKAGNGRRLWLYEENRCVSPKTFTFNFLVH